MSMKLKLFPSGGGMLYPVDFLSNESYDDLEEQAGEYQHSLLFDNPCEPATLKLNNGHTVTIEMFHFLSHSLSNTC